MTAKDKLLQLTPLLGKHTAKEHFLNLFNGIATLYNVNINSEKYVANIDKSKDIANLESSDYTTNISQPVYKANIQNIYNAKD